MKYFILVLLFAGTVEAGGPYHARARVERFYDAVNVRTYVRADSHYANPYFAPNDNYLPPSLGYGEEIDNPFYTPDAPLAKPPRRLLEILTPGTYKIKTPEPEAYGPPPRRG